MVLAPRAAPGGKAHLVTAERQGPLAVRATESLDAAKVAWRAAPPEELPDGGIYVLLDDPSLPIALPRLMQRSSGREALSNTILVVADASHAGLLLVDGFRDVVAPEAAGKAVAQALNGAAPVVHERVKSELEARFLPALVTELRLRASEAQRLLREGIELVHAEEVLAKHLARFEKMARRQAIGEAYVASGMVESFASRMAEVRRPRPDRLRPFPELRLAKATFDTGEPRLKKRHATIVPDCIAWLDNADLIGSLAAPARAELDTIGREQAKTPVAAFRACLALVRRERSARLQILRHLYEGIAPSAAVESWLDEHHGFGVLPPGFAMPSHLVRLIMNHVHPPPEVYTTWCLDLSAMRLVMTSEVLGLIARELAPSSLTTRRAVTPPPAKELEST